MAKTLTCSRCGKEVNQDSDPAVGYGTTAANHRICYRCCADEDRERLRRGEPIALYLNEKTGEVTNWPGTLRIGVICLRRSHGWGFGTRYPIVTFRFAFEGREYRGKVQGNMDLARCQPTKT